MRTETHTAQKTEQTEQGEVRLVVTVDKTFELQVSRTAVKQHDTAQMDNLLPYLRWHKSTLLCEIMKQYAQLLSSPSIFPPFHY